MKNLRRYLNIIGLICLFGLINSVKAQQQLTIGDVLDKDVMGTAVNYVKDQLSLSDFKNKAIVLDFWATWCGSCVDELPKLDSLQKVYKDDLQIVLVSSEAKEKIAAYLKNNKRLKDITLPSVVADKELRKTFPHMMIPHKVWLNAAHKVVAITGSADFNAANIEQFIKNETFSFRPKIDILTHNRKKPYLIDNNGGTNQKLIANFTLSGHNPGLNSFITFKRDSLNRITGLTAMNVDVLKMLVIAYGKNKYDPLLFNRTVLSVRDSSQLPTTGNIPASWMDRTFCYDMQLATPTNNMDSVCLLMQQDLRRGFPFYGRIEKREIECLVLCRTSTQDKIKTKGGLEEISIIWPGEHRLVNSSLASLIGILNTNFTRDLPYIVDQTNYTGHVDMKLGNKNLFVKSNTLNVVEIRKQLQKYDLDLVRKKTMVDVLVIYQD